MKNKLCCLALVTLLLSIGANSQTTASRDRHYPAIEQFLMRRRAEVVLAWSAAPANVSNHATVRVLTSDGFKLALQGTNGFVCQVMRAFSAPTYTPAEFRELVYDASVRAPFCFNPQAAREVLPYYDLRTELALRGKNSEEIAQNVEAAYSRGVTKTDRG